MAAGEGSDCLSLYCTRTGATLSRGKRHRHSHIHMHIHSYILTYMHIHAHSYTYTLIYISLFCVIVTLIDSLTSLAH